ncbi:Ribonuclease 3-like protein [Thalictrum thalictroides]|uniref:Ribonuclease 3-like protein n=1 Tax=Thalictrum thalictroides TaxID=46969 RepID=A0A7J6X242_THATH|nr:Ribonuclease 3-like protein [Thalictrum thalictroides]
MGLKQKDRGVYQYIRVMFQDEDEEKEKEKVWLLSLEDVEEILSYKFSDKNLLKEAFTHPSYYYPDDTKESYERLELLGDSVLNLIISKEMFLLYPDSSPGLLTRLRAANVDNEKLARVAFKYRLYPYLRHKAPDMEDQVQAFSNDIQNYPVHSYGLIDTPKFLADIVESIIGAVFIDSNYSLDTVWKVFKRLLEPIIGPKTLRIHPMTELYELCQKNKISINFVDGSKSETYKTFSVVLENNIVIGTSTCASRKEIVKNRAAKAALDHLKATLPSAN